MACVCMQMCGCAGERSCLCGRVQMFSRTRCLCASPPSTQTTCHSVFPSTSCLTVLPSIFRTSDPGSQRRTPLESRRRRLSGPALSGGLAAWGGILGRIRITPSSEPLAENHTFCDLLTWAAELFKGTKPQMFLTPHLPEERN